MNEPPYVSIVIPTCNRRDALARCLNALADQTNRGFEIIVVDDCSTDDTPAVLQRFQEAHAELPFRFLRNDRHLGANPSRNRGVAEAAAELIAFLDCDCLPREHWLERLIAPFADDSVAAVTGIVEEPPPRNIYELTFKGTNRVHGRSAAPRLVAGNMCVRRAVLNEYGLDEDRAAPERKQDGSPDIAVSGRGDEEGLFLRLKAAGRKMRVAPDAVVLHDHPLGGRAFFGQAFRGGRSAARLVYKYHLPPRLDMLPFMLAYLSLPLMFLDVRFGLLAAFFLAAALAAIIYNDLFRKAKTLLETAVSFPILLAYYHVRLVGYVTESLRLRLRLTQHGLRRERLNAS